MLPDHSGTVVAYGDGLITGAGSRGIVATI
jgi:hypothetical protein